MMEHNPVISINDVTIGYRRGRHKLAVLNGLNACLHQGEMVCLVGENGIGKSTLLRTIAGLQPPLKGQIAINGQDLKKIDQQKLAKTLSLVLTDRIAAGNLTVEELIALGRHPYTNWLGNFTREDLDKIAWALEITGLNCLKNEIIHELSDGQFQKVLIARALAQDGDIIILDEPTIHLDLVNKISVLKLLKDLSSQTDKSILMATHDLDFSFQIADKIWLMLKDQPLLSGTPEDLMLNHTFAYLIENEAVHFDMSNGRFSVNNESFWECNLEGDKTGVFWTENALRRNHWKITGSETRVRIKVVIVEDRYQWILDSAGREQKANTVEEFISKLKKLK